MVPRLYSFIVIGNSNITIAVTEYLMYVLMMFSKYDKIELTFIIFGKTVNCVLSGSDNVKMSVTADQLLFTSLCLRQCFHLTLPYLRVGCTRHTSAEASI